MFETLTNNWQLIAVGVIVLWLFSAAVGAMPKPGASTSGRYQFFYDFLHTVAGNISPMLARLGGAFNRLLSKKLDNVAPENKPPEDKKEQP